jgi:dolichol-phosphate mannosyltransferase
MQTSALTMPALSIVVPCYNEADGIAGLATTLLPVAAGLAARYGATELVFVDDGSRDDTWARLHELRRTTEMPGIEIRLERHKTNRGLGAALRTGFQAAAGAIVVTTDSDATYRFEEIPLLLERMTPGVDIVTASPYHPEGHVANVPGYRLVLSRGSSLLYRVLVRWDVHCYTALFRGYRREVVKTVPFAADGFLAGTELLVNAIQRGYRVAEYPTTQHARVHGVSKAKLVRTIRAHLRFQGSLLAGRLGVGLAGRRSPGAGDHRVRAGVQRPPLPVTAGMPHSEEGEG